MINFLFLVWMLILSVGFAERYIVQKVNAPKPVLRDTDLLRAVGNLDYERR